MVSVPICRFKFPKFPIDETCLVKALPKDTDEKLIKERKADYSKLIKFLISSMCKLGE